MHLLEELLSFLCGASVVLTVIAVVGHGLWSLVARFVSVFRTVQHRESASRPCEFCQAPDGVVGDHCRKCGAPVSAPRDDRLRADLYATRRQLQRWTNTGRVSPESATLLRALINADLDSVLTPTHQPSQSASSVSPVSSLEAEAAAPAVPELPAAAATPVAEQIPHLLAGVAPADEVIAAEIVAAEVVEVHPLDRATEPVAPVQRPSVPRRAIADVLQAFMEQRNIRWVELISGLLVVGGATGLVVSLRAALQDRIPYFPAFSFLLITAAFHVAGIYSLRRWNLKSTSRGVLVIGTLLVPLSILAAILLSGEGESQRSATDPLFLLAAAIGVASFGTMNYFAARALVRHGWWRVMLGVLGPSLGQLIVNRWPMSADQPAISALGMLVPLGTYAAAMVASLVWFRRRRDPGERAVQRYFLELGLGSFAVLAPLGLYLSRGETLMSALQGLSPLLSLTAATLLSGGLIAHRLLVRPKLVIYKTVGGAVAILGGGLMLIALGFAWPSVPILVLVGLLNFAVLTGLALAGDLAVLHFLAVISLGLAWLFGYHGWQGTAGAAGGNAAELLRRAVLSGQSGGVLTLFATLVAGGGLCLLRRKREMGLAYWIGGAAWGGVCVLLVAYVGFWLGPTAGGNWATAQFLYFAVAALVGAWFTQRERAGWAGAALILAAALHACWRNSWLEAQWEPLVGALPSPWLAAAANHCGLAATLAGIAATWLGLAARGESATRAARHAAVVEPLAHSALIVSVVSLPMMLWAPSDQVGWHAVLLAASSSAWLCFFLTCRTPWAWPGFQAVVTAALVYATVWKCQSADWWTGNYAEARHLHTQFLVLGASCLGWLAIRILAERGRRRYDIPRPVELTTDQVVLAVLSIATVVAAFVGCGPGLLNEVSAQGLSATDGQVAATLRLVSGSAWWSWGVILAATVVQAWTRRRISSVLLIVIASGAVPLLAAGSHFEHHATASAMRWYVAWYAVFWSVPAFVWGGRRPLGGEWEADVPGLPRLSDVCRVVPQAAALFVVLGITTTLLIRVADSQPVGQPTAASIFTTLGLTVSYVVPLLLLVGVMFALAWRDQSPRQATLASIFFQYALALGCLLPAVLSGASAEIAVIRVVQWNAVGLALVTGAWVCVRRLGASQAGSGEPWYVADLRFLQFQQVLAAGYCGLLALWAAVIVWRHPSPGNLPLAEVGGWPAYCALGAAALLNAGLIRWTSWGSRLAILATVAALAVPVGAATAQNWFGSGNLYLGHHLSVVGWMATGLGIAGWLTWLRRVVPWTAAADYSSPATFALGATTVNLILGTWSGILIHDVIADLWYETAAAALAVVACSLVAVRLRCPPFAYASLVYAGFVAYLGHASLPPGSDWGTELGLFPQFGFCIVVVAGMWLAIDVALQRHGQLGLAISGRGGAHRFAGRMAIAAALLFIAFASLHLIVASRPIQLKPPELLAFVVAIGAFLGLQFGSFWDRRGYYGAFGLYVGVLSTGLFTVELLPLGEGARRVGWMAVLALQVALAGWIWSWGAKLAMWGRRWGMHDPVESLRRAEGWLAVVNLILAVEVLLASTWSVVSFESRGLRAVAGSLPWLVAAGLAGIAERRPRATFRLCALWVAAWGLVLLGWADLSPGWETATLLARSIRMLMALIVSSFLLGVIGARVLANDHRWRDAIRWGAVSLTAASCVTLLSVLGLEFATFEPGVGTPISRPQVAAVSLVLLGLVVTLISLAVLPGRDPLRLSEKGRMGYVYAAQVVSALLFAHIYLSVPEWFSGGLRYYWPYIVLVIAFAGVAAGTLMERLGWQVLAEPFRRSGSFLPLVPALGMWMIESRSEYSSVLFVIGVFYMLLSFTNRSPWAAAAAGIAGNGGFWSLLRGYENLAFAQHPQFWLIPPAVSIMVAAQLNRQRLGELRLAAIRYAAMVVIYLSSSVEIIMRGIGDSLWQPVILICLSLAGMALGIALRVRAFLYFGSVFVLVSLISMVAHAARSLDHVWPWWAFVIVMGVAILVLFGYFEGRRAQIQALIDRLRSWEK